MSYRNDLDALSARQAALEAEVRDRQRELADARRLVEEIQERARLPVLDNIRVAAPCAASWAAMIGDDRVRACGDCNKNVYNLSELTRDQAEALIVEHEGRLCVRYYRRADGTILLNDCAVGVKRRRRRRVAAAGVAASLAGAALGYTYAGGRTHATLGMIAPDGAVPESQAGFVMGDFAPSHELKDGKDEPQAEPRLVPPAPPQAEPRLVPPAPPQAEPRPVPPPPPRVKAKHREQGMTMGVLMISHDANARTDLLQREHGPAGPAPTAKRQPRDRGVR